MTAIDYTSLYSADIAIENENFLKDEDQWFLYCLTYLTQRLLLDNSISVFIPPTSDEENRKQPLILNELLSEGSQFTVGFCQSVAPMKDLAIKATRGWAKQHFDDLQSLQRNQDFWKQPRILKWWNWHKQNEMVNHIITLQTKFDVVGRDFADVIDDIGAKDEMQRYTLDVIIRGCYYRALNNGASGLHPIRIGQLVQSKSIVETSQQIDKNDYVTGLILMKLLVDTQSFGNSGDRIRQWMNCVKIAKQHMQSRRDDNISQRPAELAKLLKIPGWEQPKYSGIYQTVKKNIVAASVPLGAVAAIVGIADPTITAVDSLPGHLTLINYLFEVIDPHIQAATSYDVQLRSTCLSNMSDSIMSLAVRSEDEDQARA